MFVRQWRNSGSVIFRQEGGKMKSILHSILSWLFLVTLFGPLIRLNAEELKILRIVDDSVLVWWSSELLPGSIQWYTNPPGLEEITYKLTRQKDIGWEQFHNDKELTFYIDTTKSFQKRGGLIPTLFLFL